MYDLHEIPDMGEGFFPHFVRRNNADIAACVRKKRACNNLGAGKFANLSPIFEVLYLQFPTKRLCFNIMSQSRI